MDIRRSRPTPTLGFEFVDIEIIAPLKQKVAEKWDCDHCSLFYMTQDQLNGHKQRQHNLQVQDQTRKCKYCNKTIIDSAKNKVCYANRKCETCEYRCSFCPKRFLRHSSLMNHERNHKVLKINNKSGNPTSKISYGSTKNNKTAETKLPCNTIKNEKIQKKIAPKRKALASNNSEIDLQDEISLSNNKIKRQKVSVLDEEISNTKLEKNKARLKKNIAANTKVPCLKKNIEMTSESISTANEKNVANYKPFSCHVCGDTYASDSALINHIKSHGENALSTFKCKYCGDIFADVYNMQFHLAICPLAEDELESTIVQTKPTKVPSEQINYTPDLKLPQKKGQDCKIRINKSSTPQKTRRSQRRKSTVNYMASNSIDDCHFQFPKPQDNSNYDIQIFNETNKPQVSYKEFLNNDPDVDPPENIEITSPQNILPGQSFDKNGGHRIKDHICPFPRCGMKFSREKALLCHMRNHSDDFEDTLKCHKCDIPFDDIHSLRPHVNMCKGIKEEKDDDFNQPNYSGSKTKNSSSKKSRNEMMCKVCGRSYTTLEKLNRHVLRHGSNNFLCQICSQVFNNQHLLDKHNFARHPIKSPYYCQVCNENFISELFLQIHKSDYHGDGDQNKTTPKDISLVNGKPTSKRPPTRSKVLKNHDSSHRYVGKTFTGGRKNNCWCPVCYEKFDDKASLRYHLNQRHAFKSKGMYVCEVCEMTKPNREMLCCHLELHSINPLSVNRFSKLRGHIDKNYSQNIKRNKSFLKSENLNDDENRVEIKQECPDNMSPRGVRPKITRKSENTCAIVTKSLPSGINVVPTTTQLVEGVSPMSKRGRKKRENSQIYASSINSNSGKNCVDPILQSGTLEKNQTTETKKNINISRKPKGKGRKKSKGKSKRKVVLNKKKPSTSGEYFDDEIALDSKNTTKENEFSLSPMVDGQKPFHDSHILFNEDANSGAEKKCDEDDEDQDVTNNSSHSTAERLSKESSGEVSGSSSTSIDGRKSYKITKQVLNAEHGLEPFRSENEAILNDDFKCIMCSQKFGNQDDLVDHVFKFHI